MLEIQASDHNTDGSLTIKLDGKDIKYVLQSDLGAVKASLKTSEGEVSTLQTSLATANVKADESHQEVLKERTARQSFETEAGKSTALVTEVEGLKTKVTDLEKVGGEQSTKFTERLRTILTDGYKIDPEKIKDFTLPQLEQTEQTLLLTGAKAQPANFDGPGGGNGSAGNLQGKSPMSLAVLGYSEKSPKD